jgi:Type II secretion system (T2SS), protein N
MKRIAFCALLMLVAVAVALWAMPASIAIALLPNAVAQQMAKHVAFHEITGTLWQGSARFTVSAVPPTLRVSWRCAPSIASLAIDCQWSDAITGNTSIAPFQKRITISALKAAIPLRVSLPGANVFASEWVSLELKTATVSAQQTWLTGSLIATNAVSYTGNTSINLGEISIDCVPLEKAATSRCTLRNRASDNRVDGQIELSADRVSGSATFTPAGGATQQISF